MLLALAACLWASGIVPAIIPASVPAAFKVGNSAKFQLGATSGPVAGDCAAFDINLNVTGAGTGAGCATSAGGGVFLSGTTDPGVPATPTIVQSGIANAATVAYSGSVTTGNCSVVTVVCSGGGSIGVPTDTLSTNYGAAVNSSSFTSGGCCTVLMSTYLGTLTSSGANTVASNNAGCGAGGLSIMELHGSTCTIDVVGQRVQNVNGPPAVTTTVTNDLLILSTSINVPSGTHTVTATPPAVVDQSLLVALQRTIGALGHMPTGAPGTYTPIFVNDSGAGDASQTTAIRATPVASPGNDGDFYLNLTSGVLWGPKTSGSWSESGLSLVSTTGSNDHVLFGGSAPAVSSCGTGMPAATGTDNAGKITIGGGTVTACTLTFATAFASAPSCRIQTASSAITTQVTSVSTSALVIGFSADVGTATVYYSCF